MDRRFKSDTAWFISPHVVLSEFKADAFAAADEMRHGISQPPRDHVVVKEEVEEHDRGSDFSRLAGCSKKTAKRALHDDLKISRLVPSGGLSEPHFRTFTALNHPDNWKTQGLHAISRSVERDRHLGTEGWRRWFYNSKLKYDRYDRGAGVNFLKRSFPTWDMRGARDILVNVTAYHPFNRIVTNEELRSNPMKPASKWVLRGDTPLLDLRRKLMCVSDFAADVPPGSELEKPDVKMTHLVKYPSSFLFIDNTFYVDDTMPGAGDISRPIREFMARKKCFEPARTQSIQGVRIVDLKLRLGQPYVFIHSGNCEHLLIFNDLRTLEPLDEQNLDKYPITVFERGSDTMCAACKRDFATMMVTRSDRLPTLPSFFCQACFEAFHYTHGARMGDFTAYPYFQSTRLSGLSG